MNSTPTRPTDSKDRPADPETLRQVYQEALTFSNPLTSHITTEQFSTNYPDPRPWMLGPFRRSEKLHFVQPEDWPDPTGIGWRNGFVFNPSILTEGDDLHLFYRASPRKESLSSRIGHAKFNPTTGWVDDPANPVISPTRHIESLSIDDPKVYRRDDGLYVMFYNAIWAWTGSEEAARHPSSTSPMGDVACDVMVAVSHDLSHWHKQGPVVGYDISQGWAKGAVIPRNPAGDAVRIGGEYLMYLSEGCGGHLVVGHSPDLLTWTYEVMAYLDLSALGGALFEVASATTGHVDTDDLVLDFFYNTADGELAAGQALYNTSAPFRQLDIARGGPLAWGGLAEYDGSLYFAQGWDAAEGSRELYFYQTTQTNE